MKTKILIISILLLSITTFAQIKVFPAGNVSIGTTYSPINNFGVSNLIVGQKIAFPQTASTITSSALIKGNNSYSTKTNPDYSWYNDDITGIFHPGNSQIGFATYGQERLLINSTIIKANSYNDWNGIFTINAYTTNTTGFAMRPNGGAATFYVHASGYIVSQGVYIHSDESIKTNIQTVSSALDKITALRGVTYDMNLPEELSAFSMEGTQLGLIAQEVEEIVPEVVKTLHDGTKAVAYQNLVGLLIEAIKEQQTQITQLESNINECCNPKTDSRSATMPSDNDDANSSIDSKLYQNNPNPFSISTNIQYTLGKEVSSAQIIIFDMQGNLIKTYNSLRADEDSIQIHSSELTAGMYMYSLIVNGQEVDTKKMILTE